MPRLVFEKYFIRKATKLVKGNPGIDNKLTKTLSLLEKDIFTPSLKTHALTGDLKNRYACSLSHNLRIIFKLTDDIVHLLDIGSHDEVY